jgi:ribonuclease D
MKTYKFGNTVIHLHQNDIPKNINLSDVIAIDSETTGLSLVRDKLRLIQLAVSDKECHFIKFDNNFFQDGKKPNELINLLSNPNITKIFHYARFDLAMIKKYLELNLSNVFCTKVASKLVRTYTDKHGLKDLCKELLKKDLNKSSQSSDWSIEELSNDQLKYASHDVIHLFKLKLILEKMLVREGRINLAKKTFEFLPSRVDLDLSGWNEIDIFSH